MKWKVYYLEAVENWLDALQKDQLKSISKEIVLLECCGNKLRLPHSRSLCGGLFELRDRRFGIRIYYCFHEKEEILILHGGSKKGQEKDIEKARELLKKMSR